MPQNPSPHSPFPAYRARVLRVLAGGGSLPLIHQVALRLGERLLDLNRPATLLFNASLSPATLQASLPATQPWATDAATAHGLLSNLWLTVQEEPAIWLHTQLKHLPPDSPLLATTLGSQSLHQLHAAWQAAGLPPRSQPLPLPDVQAAGALLQRLKLALPVVDRDTITLTFPTIHSLLKTLQTHGALVGFQTVGKGLLTPRQLARLEATWQNLFPRPDNRLPLTLEVLYLHGFTPAPSQPTAAKRGSGTRLSFVRITPPEEH